MMTTATLNKTTLAKFSKLMRYDRGRAKVIKRAIERLIDCCYKDAVYQGTVPKRSKPRTAAGQSAAVKTIATWNRWRNNWRRKETDPQPNTDATVIDAHRRRSIAGTLSSP